MNIGIFTDTYYPQINGVVTSVRTLEKELAKRGHKVFVFTVSHPNAKTAYPRVFRLPSMPFVFLPSHRVGVLYSPKAVSIVKKINLDIIHTHTEFSLGLFGRMMAKQLNIPWVHTYHTMYEEYVHYISKGMLNRLTPKMVANLSRVFCNKCNTIIAPTDKVKDLLENYGVKKPIQIIPTGINLQPFKRENFNKDEIIELRKRYGITESDPVILFVGRIAKEKSIDIIIKQMPSLVAKLANAKLLIVGDGPIKKDLLKLCKNLNLEDSVIFTGEQPWESIGLFYQLGNVFVSASTSETQGLTFAEAMAAQIPVVAKNDKSIEGIIQDKINGRIFSNDEELANILFKLLTDNESCKILAANAAKTVEEFSSESFAKKIEEVYYSILQ
ncbi:MAG TPA: glycosyltransferase family 4 protein [Defluviitaleaceae bacterium]|mgnify:FL=1|nr:glycosyltransferase family 4 protein [Defluviitaleaceae bacterium]